MFKRDALREITLGYGTDDARDLLGWLDQVACKRVDRLDSVCPGPTGSPEIGPLRDPALLADDPGDACCLTGVVLEQVGEVVERLDDRGTNDGLPLESASERNQSPLLRVLNAARSATLSRSPLVSCTAIAPLPPVIDGSVFSASLEPGDCFFAMAMSRSSLERDRDLDKRQKLSGPTHGTGRFSQRSLVD